MILFKTTAVKTSNSTSFKVLSWYLPPGVEENNGKPQ
jgi:hypothetical protein